MSITKLTTIPAADKRIGSGSWMFQSATGLHAFVSAVSSTGTPTFPALGTRDWLIWGRMCSLNNVANVYALAIRLDSTASLTVARRNIATANVTATFRISSTSNVATLEAAGVPAGFAFDGATHWAVKRVGSNMTLYLLRGYTDAIASNTVAITHSGDMGVVTNGGTLQLGRQHAASWGQPAWFGHCTIARCGNAVTMNLTDEQIRAVCLDPQQIDDYAIFDEIASYGDIRVGGNLVDPKGLIEYNVADTVTNTCPRTGYTTSLVANGTPSQGIHVAPRYVQPTQDRFDQFPTLSPTKVLATVVGDAMIATTYGRWSSTNRTHPQMIVMDAAGNRVRWPLPVLHPIQYIDGSTHALVTLPSMHNSGFRPDIHYRSTALPFDDAIAFNSISHSDTLNNFPTTGDRIMSYSHVKLLTDADLNPTPLWIHEECGADGPDVPTGTAYASAQAAWDNWRSSYQMNVRKGDWWVQINRHMDTFAGRCAAWAVNAAGDVRFRQLEDPANSSSSLWEAGIPRMAIPLTGNRFILGWNPRVSGGSGYPSFQAVIGQISGDGADFAAAANWYAAGTGERLDGSGPNELELGTSSVNTSTPALNIFEDNDGIPLAERTGCILGCAVGRGTKIATIWNIDDNGADVVTRETTDIIMMNYRYIAAENRIEETNRVSLWSLFSDDTALSMSTSRMSLQYTDAHQRGAILLFAHRNGETLSGSDGPSAEIGRFGSHVRMYYFPNIHEDPATYHTLDPIWDRAGQLYTAVAPGNIGFEPDYSAMVAGVGVIRVTDSVDASTTLLFHDIAADIAPFVYKDEATLLGARYGIHAYHPQRRSDERIRKPLVRVLTSRRVR